MIHYETTYGHGHLLEGQCQSKEWLSSCAGGADGATQYKAERDMKRRYSQNPENIHASAMFITCE